MAQRYKIDAQGELVSLEARIASARKTLRDTAQANTARITEAVLPSLERRAEALRHEVETLPDRPPLDFRGGGNFPCLLRDYVLEPLTAAELETLEVPAFLQRAVGSLR